MNALADALTDDFEWLWLSTFGQLVHAARHLTSARLRGEDGNREAAVLAAAAEQLHSLELDWAALGIDSASLLPVLDRERCLLYLASRRWVALRCPGEVDAATWLERYAEPWAAFVLAAAAPFPPGLGASDNRYQMRERREGLADG